MQAAQLQVSRVYCDPSLARPDLNSLFRVGWKGCHLDRGTQPGRAFPMGFFAVEGPSNLFLLVTTSLE
jgi:hypothetical protein